jgi:hypothetical protein
MSGIPPNPFKAVAPESLDDKLRASRGSEETRVNKGAIGNKTAIVLESISRAVDLVGDDSRKLRQEQVIRAFAESLKDR